jgi:phospholipid/cholesterol/gamma-HCH transport system ATP-binding protein
VALGKGVCMLNNTRPVLKLTNVCKSFDGKALLSGIDLSVLEGDRLCILGPGGCGKSTLLKTILGILPIDEGTIELMGQNVAVLSKADRQDFLKKVGMAFQQGALFDFMTVRENILFAMENMTKLSHMEMEERVQEMLAAVYLPNVGHKLPSELSGGMRRRVGIVRALSTDPKIVFLDEPTAGLDPVTSTVVIDMIHALGTRVGSTLVCVTSSVEVAFTFAKKVAILRDGKILAQGTWPDLHALGDPWVTKFLDVRDFVPAEFRTDKVLNSDVMFRGAAT